MSKRNGYISWDEYFMGVALLASQRSKDPSTQVGACIVNDDNRIMSVGYNGFPRGCSDDEFPWEREGDKSTLTKYPYVCHAELNAILNAGGNSLKGCRIYVALFPCNECAKAIIQCGIKKSFTLAINIRIPIMLRQAKKCLSMPGLSLPISVQIKSSLLILMLTLFNLFLEA